MKKRFLIDKDHKTVRENLLITFGILSFVVLLCFFFQQLSSTDTHVPLLFVLAVLFISRFTDGYFYGIASSIAAVFGVNFAFTYPYFELDFSVAGYPLTFFAMLTVAVIVSALTTRIKKQEQMKLEIEREQMRSNLLRAVSHDLRTPLTSIMGSASAVLENYDSLSKEKQLELIGDIREESQWLLRIMENLLSVTRINSENAKLELEEELAEEVVSSAVLKFKKRFPDCKVSVKIPDEVLVVAMDAILIEQVLINLMENSVYHGKTVTQIEVSIARKNEMAVFSVKDNGKGIDKAVLPVMFAGDLHSSEGKEADGRKNMGIGLSVCKTIVNAHHGTIKAKNREEGGACVSFSLPLESEEDYGNKG